MNTPVLHWEINTKEPARLLDFYRNLFEWKIQFIDQINYGLADTGSKKGIQGGIGRTHGEGPSFVTFYVEVDDPQHYLDKAINLGATMVTPVTEIPNMVTFAQFRDLEGHIIGIIKQEAAPAKPRRKKARGKKKSRTSKRRRR